jgi:hypothetical protein
MNVIRIPIEELDDGRLFTVYYQRYADDPKTSILYTKWKLNQI